MKNQVLFIALLILSTFSPAQGAPVLSTHTPIIDCSRAVLSVLRAIPKVHLHVHLEGNVRFSTIVQLAQENRIDLGVNAFNKAVIRQPEGANRVEGLEKFLERFSVVQKVLGSYGAIKRVTMENIEDAYNEGVRILELRFAPAFISIAHPQLTHPEIFRAVVDATVEASKKYPDMKVGLIHILVRLHQSAGDANYFAELNKKATFDLFDFLETRYPGSEHIVGFDLAGAEAGTKFSDYDLYVQLAKQKGLKLTVHTGEDSSAAHIRETILRWNPLRIGHGIQASKDKNLQALIKERGIHMEIAPTSNWLSRASSSLENHPIREFFDNGIKISINTDDGHLQNIGLLHEYALAHLYYGFSIQELRQINEQAAKASFIVQ